MHSHHSSHMLCTNKGENQSPLLLIFHIQFAIGHLFVWSQSSLSLPLLLQDGWTALMLAAQNGHLEVAKQLISSRASVNATDEVSGGGS